MLHIHATVLDFRPWIVVTVLRVASHRGVDVLPFVVDKLLDLEVAVGHLDLNFCHRKIRGVMSGHDHDKFVRLSKI